MHRYLAILMILAPILFLGDDRGPHTTQAEIMAMSIRGFFLAQEIQARRCDEFLAQSGLPNTPPQSDMHDAMERKYRAHLEEVDRIMRVYYRRIYQQNWEKQSALVTAETTRQIERIVDSRSPMCRDHAEKLEGRLAMGWSNLRRMIEEGINRGRQ